MPVAPQARAFPYTSAFCTCSTARSGFTAFTAKSFSPLWGQVMVLKWGLFSQMPLPMGERETAMGSPLAPASRARLMLKLLWCITSSGPGHALLHCPAVVVAYAGGDVSHPGGYYPAHQAGGDYLVEDDVGNGPHQGEAAGPEADYLVQRGKRLEPLQGAAQGDFGAGPHQFGHRLLESHYLVC